MAFSTLGMMASLGHNRAVARLLFVRLCGVLAWLIRRTYYLLQTPGFERKLRMVVDWTLALLLPPDLVKVNSSSRATLPALLAPRLSLSSLRQLTPNRTRPH